ncbi:type IV secretory system conjugative DNA transfer family protein [Microcoleus sp. FACHB-1515]|uniref:type IV secretory system conjugative DNA transfer family protein n=1 Tax=Cyanophyceae TaxID=3028117 RepID=UPI001682599B|nr:type IV secretion system DNA-binding domain-containing protein [Microcoleus sp. FACHB-1515]MBD2093334.1 type IV secretory system conjugative DNA transfer family protein [Microcoleus sp. FACHB-1515]
MCWVLGSVDIGGLLGQFNNLQGYLLIGGLVLMVVLSQGAGTGGGKISTGKLCGSIEKVAATRQALRQVQNIRTLRQFQRHPEQFAQRPRPKHNELTLWCGTPQYWRQGWGHEAIAIAQTLLGAMPTVWLPDAQRSALVLGAPGSGKTFSVIDPAIESAFQQGVPCLIYDKKGDQMRLHAPLASRYGYEVFVFAPGESFSGVINPLDYLKDEQDSVMAGEIGQVINRNASSGGKTDEFFSKAGDMLAKALLQLVKGMPSAEYCDMAMLYAVMQLPQLVKRIDHAVQSRSIEPWVAASFNQFLASKEAEKTVSGILTTAAGTFSSFIQADLLRAFLGPSNIPRRITGKQVIFFKLDDARRTVVGPLLAAAIHLCIVSNLSTPRPDPLAVFLDEFPSLKFDGFEKKINEYRSNGGCFILGAQSLNQLYETYGEKMGAAIASACSTHILFNPGEPKTAEEYSKRYGEKEVLIKSKSTSRSSGAQSSVSTSFNESLQRLPLFTVDQILRFPAGKCVITNPGYSSGGEGSIPFPVRIPVSKSDKQRRKDSEQLWESHVMPSLELRVDSRYRSVDDPHNQALTQALYDRMELAEQLLPLPNETTMQQATGGSGQTGSIDVLDSMRDKYKYQFPGFSKTTPPN